MKLVQVNVFTKLALEIGANSIVGVNGRKKIKKKKEKDSQINNFGVREFIKVTR